MVDPQASAIGRSNAHPSTAWPLPLPAADAADVWIVDLEDYRETAAGAPLLPHEGAMMTGSPARARTRIALRQLLSGYTGLPTPAIALTTGLYGKPEMQDSSLSFNVSRRGDTALIAVAAQGRIGVDIERHGPLPELESISAMLHPEEHAQLSRMPRPVGTAAFYRIWTRKEAALKAIGRGTTAGLDDFSVLSDQIPMAVSITGGPTRTGALLLRDLPLGQGWSGALATERTVISVRLRAFSPADPRGRGL
jgi:4'-phosphopantetheinyl transferase